MDKSGGRVEVAKEYIQDGVEDEFGVVYSRDGKRLLNGRNLKLECYEIKVGTEEICEDAFISNDWTLRQITIPDTVTIIGFRAFGWCHSLQQIIIPNSVKFIGDSAFIYCTSLRQVTMSNSVTSIGEKVFCDCEALEQITIPNSVTKIGNEAFWGCEALKQINIPDSVTLIGDSAFADCHYLQQITIPDSVTMIGKNPFVACWNLNITSNSSRFVIDNECLTDNHKIIISYFGKKMSIVIPDTVTKIGDSAFEVCSTLKHITIPETVTEIGNSAFLGCSMSQIEIPNSVKTLGYSVFRQCLSLQKITLSNSVTTISASAFYDCISLQRISIPDSVKAIDYGAFWGCRALQQIIIPESVTTIGDFAFRECKSLQKINIPNSVTTIGKCIFNRCDSLPPIIAYELFNRIGDNVVDQNIYSQKKTEHIRIKKIRIKNFRAFVDEEVYIDNFNCIIGKNDTGKSTILAALEWFFDVNKELNKNDLNAGDRDRYFGAALTQYDDTHAPHDIAVEVYFSGVEENNKDFIDNEGCVCIRKKMSYSTKNSKAYREMKYSIKKYSFRQMNGKVISECSFDELKYEYKKVASPSDKLWNKIQELEENEKNNNKNAECFKEREKTYGVDEDMYKFIEKLKPVEEQICEKLYLHYGNSEREEQWMDYIKEKEMEIIHWQIFSLMKEIVNSYKLNLYTSNTSLNNYLNDLLKIKYSASIEDTKSRMAKDLSKMLADNSVSESIRFEKNETINLFTTDNLLLSSGNIPLKNRGEGIQLQIKNAVFKILTGIQSKNHKTIFAFEEPETHLHPSAQIEMYETIKELSNNPNYQVFITTHSPYIVKQLAEDNINPIVVKRDENLKISTISKLEERVLPYVSMNEVNYIAFDEPSIEYHIELFGYIHNKLIDRFENDNSFNTYWNATMTKPNRNGVQTIVRVTSIKGVDVWFENCCAAKKYRWFETDNYGEERRTLPYCVRNNIDHPLKTDDASKANGHKAFVNNNKYFKQWIIAKSIEIMRNAILNNPDIFK